MTEQEIHKAIREIGLALNLSHNTIATDNINAKPQKDYSWKIDNDNAMSELKNIETLLRDIGIYHGCDCCNNLP